MTQWQYNGLNLNDSSGSIYFEKQMSYMFYGIHSMFGSFYQMHIYIDYNKLSYRNDYHSVRGATRINSTSIWIKNILYIIDFTTDPFACQVLDMGFGMPTPDWFVDGEFKEYVYLLQGRDDDIKRTMHFSKDSPDGPFHYFATDTGQRPFRLSAPVITAYDHVVNNWYDYREYNDLNDEYFNFYKQVCTNTTAKHLMNDQKYQNVAQKALGFMYQIGMLFKS